MRVLVAADKFKDALTARQACGAITEGLRRAHPEWTLIECPLTDGGEGFAEILTRSAGGRWVSHKVTGPRSAPVLSGFGLVSAAELSAAILSRLGINLAPSSRIAVIEMASASGLALLRAEERDVWRTHTTGTGELISAAVACGVDGILLGVGGSATHDLGLGALCSLGLKLHDREGRSIDEAMPEAWARIAEVNAEWLCRLPPIWIACDVANPLLGHQGAAAVYAPQKGLRLADLGRLESETARMATLMCASRGMDQALAHAPGTGAAGGISFGLMATVRAQLVSGFALVSDWLQIEGRLAEADIVITGEGRFDDSSLQGKGPGSLVSSALRLGKPVHVFAGRVDAHEISGVFLHEISPRTVPLNEALPKTGAWLQHFSETVFK